MVQYKSVINRQYVVSISSEPVESIDTTWMVPLTVTTTLNHEQAGASLLHTPTKFTTFTNKDQIIDGT